MFMRVLFVDSGSENGDNVYRIHRPRPLKYKVGTFNGRRRFYSNVGFNHMYMAPGPATSGLFCSLAITLTIFFFKGL